MKWRHATLTLLTLILAGLTPALSASSGPEINGVRTGTASIDKVYHYRTRYLDEWLNPVENPESRDIEINYRVDLEYIFRWQVSVFMGEPLFKAWVAFKPTNISLNYTGLSFAMLGNQKLLNKIDLTEFAMKVWYFEHISGERAMERGTAMIIDAGVGGKPYLGHRTSELRKDIKLFNKFSSFNPPGSPDWDKLFINIKDKQRAISLFRKYAAARKRLRMPAKDVRLFKIAINTDAIDSFIYKYLQKKEKELAEKQKRDVAEKKKQVATRDKADELAAALAETEAGEGATDDLLGETDGSDTTSTDSFDDLLAETEEIKLILNEVPGTTRSNVISISGLVKNASSIDDSQIVFKINSLEQPVYLQADGSFSNKLVLFNGDNRIDINYTGVATELHKSLHIQSSTPPVKARFTLVWDSSNSDMDLHVYGPGGDHCSYSNKSTANMRLDVDNTKRYGPENVSVKLQQHHGTYEAVIKHYGGNGGNVTLYVYLDNRLVATRRTYLSGRRKWRAYDLNIN